MELQVKTAARLERVSVYARLNEPIHFVHDGRVYALVDVNATWTRWSEGDPGWLPNFEWFGTAQIVKKDGTLGNLSRKVTESHGAPWEVRDAVTAAVNKVKPKWPSDEAVGDRDDRVAEIQRKYDRFVERVVSALPGCWGDTEDDVIDFIANPGHTDECECFG